MSDTPRARVREELKGLAMYARSKPSPELVEEDIGIRLDRIIAALTTPADGCEGKWRYHVEVIDGFQYNIYEKLTEKVNSFLASHDVVQVATGCERGRPTYSIVYRTPEEGENV